MAKIDWSNHRFFDAKFKAPKNTSYKDVWTLTGKHYGSHIHNLPLHYLNWIIDNFSADSNYNLEAQAELQRRYNLTNTQGQRAG